MNTATILRQSAGILCKEQQRHSFGIKRDTAELCGRTSCELTILKTAYSIEERLVNKLGPPHRSEDPSDARAPIKRIWGFPQINRRITLRYAYFVTVSILPPCRHQEADRRERKHYRTKPTEAETRDAGF